MATATGNYPADNSSLANFKSWAQAISNAFATFGWTQTADTGQVNWSTIAAVPSSTYVYEIWKAADTQAATMPIYVKMEYGFSSTQVAFRVTVGTASNGSGSITGAVNFSALVFGSNDATVANQGSTPIPCFFSGDAGEFRMMMWQGNLNVASAFGIERSKDNTGAKTTDYFTCLQGQAFGTQRQQSTLLSLISNALETSIVSVGATTGSGTGSFNGTVAAFPVFPLIGKIGNPMLGWMACVGADVGEGATVTVSSVYGGTHTFIATKVGGTNGFGRVGWYISGGIAGALLMRYE